MTEAPDKLGFRPSPGLWIGLALALGMQAFPPPEGLSAEGWRVASLGVLMAIWWATEAVPLAATGLVPLVVLPLITDMSLKGAIAPPYMSTIVILLMGGSIMAKGIERWNLHKRIALNIISRVGDHPRALLAGFMAATAIMSMWISNTAATLMMAPIALSAAAAGGDRDGVLSRALLLGIAYSASIGGVATPVGTPSNLIALEALTDNGDTSIGFLQWMAFGVPTACILVPAAWWLLSTGGVGKIGHMEAAGDIIRKRLSELGGMRTPEIRLAIVFGCVAVLWITRQILQTVPGLEALSDAGIAVFGAVLMLVIPAGKGENSRLLTWEDAEQIPWGMLLLFGGGLSLAAAIKATGLSFWIGGQLDFLNGAPAWVIVTCVVVIMIFLTELTSNVATTATLMPVLATLALASGTPFAALAGPAAVAASCAFMLPVATAPNAIVYSTGKVTVAQMIKAGFRLNLASALIIALVGMFIAPRVLG